MHWHMPRMTASRTFLEVRWHGTCVNDDDAKATAHVTQQRSYKNRAVTTAVLTVLGSTFVAVNFVGLMIFWLALFSCSSSAKRVRGCTASGQDNVSSQILSESVLPCVPLQVFAADSKMYFTLSTSCGTQWHHGDACACRNKQNISALLKHK